MGAVRQERSAPRTEPTIHGGLMAAPRVKTGPNGKQLPDGIFRQGDKYAVSYRVNGRMHWETTRTEDELKMVKARRVTEARQAKAHAKGTIAASRVRLPVLLTSRCAAVSSWPSDATC